jgi:hypothetical protein
VKNCHIFQNKNASKRYFFALCLLILLQLCKNFRSEIDVFLITYKAFCKIAKILVGMQVLTI